MSLVHQIEPLALAGMRPKDIAVRLGASQDYVRAAMSRMRKRGVPIPKFEGGNLSRTFDDRGWATLRAHAERRDLSVRALIKKTVLKLVEDDLFDAVLDDGEG
ncbi:hypothetical protein [Methylopila sp. 73B]|uniref:hypothetical protein n=1 Tax=Methylopila sp. 73B TaxID=1120792 RepID=UPI00037BC155|nr:hypothetical protein [Methylopila sp. 73B]